MKKCLISAFVSVAMLCGTQVAQAHGIWVAERVDKMAVVLGEGGMDNRYDADKISSVIALDVNNAPVQIDTINTDDNVLLDLPKEANLVVVDFDSGYHSKDADGKWHSDSKNNVANAVSGGKYSLITTTLLDHQKQPIILPKLPLQITALTDPYSHKKGDDLQIMVSSYGKPIANAKVVVDFINDPDGQTVVTDDNGRATIQISSNALNVLHTHHQIERDDKTLADTDNIASTLAFNLFSHDSDE